MKDSKTDDARMDGAPETTTNAAPVGWTYTLPPNYGPVASQQALIPSIWPLPRPEFVTFPNKYGNLVYLRTSEIISLEDTKVHVTLVARNGSWCLDHKTASRILQELGWGQ